MDLISVIVPVYKVEQYLNQCIESIVNQTYRNLEIILVDDGSPDDCPEICDEWAQKDSRIRVLHTANGGSARARNCGIELAKGEFISFVDSDDVIHPQMIQIMYSTMKKNNYDIVECDYTINGVFDFSIDTGANEKSYGVAEALSLHLSNRGFSQIVWNKLYRRDTIGGIRFTEGKFLDDVYWTYRVLASAKKLSMIKEILYFYRQQDQSVMHQRYSLRRLDAVTAYCERYELFTTSFPELSQQALLCIWFGCRYHGQMALKYMRIEDREKAFQILSETLIKYPIRYSVVFQQKKKEIIWLSIEKVSLKTVCKIRNILGIGL